MRGGGGNLTFLSAKTRAMLLAVAYAGILVATDAVQVAVASEFIADARPPSSR